MMGVVIPGNVTAALAPGLGRRVAGRMVSALAHSTLIAAFVAAAHDMAPPRKRAARAAKVTPGTGLATVIGMPTGTPAGDNWGWRATSWAPAALSLASTLLLLRHNVPKAAPVEKPGARHTAVDGRRAFTLFVTMVLVALVIVPGTGGMFALYTYTSPNLTHAAGFKSSTVTVLLRPDGPGGVAGNLIGADQPTATCPPQSSQPRAPPLPPCCCSSCSSTTPGQWPSCSPYSVPRTTPPSRR
ncbi:MFS transporter [Streptomyces aurantiogriseus]|uniref:Major facilitator superfamily (MFS) profile domain-containing protein n=1 Tax=Streptomyces aurantiogriseus TaxID=66870 RepID=A0A918L0F7_9ACTN|nr:MFS transporter [Streptomyces aurantiogriseus]GGR63746.1 hypothetical protein GCM10010251_95510 [Streptomyces aurantiogriseus]